MSFLSSSVEKAQEFTASGTFTPSSALLLAGGWVKVFLVGGGAGGGGTVNLGGGGGGQVIKDKFFQITGPISITIGAGGAGGTTGPGSNGSASSFGSLLTSSGGMAATGLWGGPQ